LMTPNEIKEWLRKCEAATRFDEDDLMADCYLATLMLIVELQAALAKAKAVQ
jgi:hypothetical protein